MKLIVLDATTKTIRAALAGAVATSNPDYVIAYADSTDSTFAEASTDGQLNGTTDVTLVGAPASGVKRTIKSISVYNRDTAPVIVVIKLDVSGTQRILQRVQLVSGETWHSDELTKLSPGGNDTQVQFNDTGTLAGSSNFTYNKTTSVLTLGANPVLTGGTANGVLYLNGSKSATTGSVLTFDGAQLGVNGITVGRGAGAVSTNTAVGASALAANTSGANQTAIGSGAAASTTTGTANTVVGRTALNANTNGSSNVAVGYQAMQNSDGVSNNTAVGTAALLSNVANNNTAVGYQAGYSNTTGINTFFGSAAGYSVTTGTNNVFLGRSSGNLTTSSFNTMVGDEAGRVNTTGAYNTFVGGRDAGGISVAYNNTTGSNNSAFGSGALGSNTTASNNTAVGYQAGYSNTTGTGTTALGYRAGASNVTGIYNTAIGGSALENNTTNHNTAVGFYAMQATTTGTENAALGTGAMQLNTTGSYNTAVGRSALFSNTTGANNIAVGYQALQANTTASNNTAVGYQAGYSQTTAGGGFNTFVGQGAGYTTNGFQNTYVGRLSGTLSTGNNNTFVGSDSGASMTTGGQNTILGRYSGNQGGLDIRTSSNHIVLSDGDGNPRGIFDGSGRFLVGTTSSSGMATINAGANQNGLFVSNDTFDYQTLSLWNKAGANDNLFARFFTEGTITLRGSIDYNRAGGLTRYNTTSDYRAKDIIGPVQNTGATIDALKVYEGVIKGATQARPMMIAHEAQGVVPFCVSGVKDENNEDGTPKYQQMDHASLVPLLIAEIQSLRARVAQLESKGA